MNRGLFYNEIKTHMTFHLGIASQVILEPTLKKEKILKMTCNNLVVQFKINIKEK